MTNWKPVSLTTPQKWYRSKAWRWGDSKWIVAAAYCPSVFALGGELIAGYGRGAALFIGPLWLGVAANFSADAPNPYRPD